MCSVVVIENFLPLGETFKHTHIETEAKKNRTSILPYTVKENEYAPFGCLWSKMAFFRIMWRMTHTIPPDHFPPRLTVPRDTLYSEVHFPPTHTVPRGTVSPDTH